MIPEKTASFTVGRCDVMEWKQEELGKHCLKIGSGATPRGGSSVYLDEGEYALIRSQNIYNEGFKAQGLAFIDSEAASRLNNVAVQENDILLNITGDSVARVCMAPSDYLPARVNQHVAIIRTDPDELDAHFVRYYLVAPDTQNLLLIMAGSGATRNALTKGMIESFAVPKPCLEIQKSVGRILRSFDDKTAINQQINQTLETMAQAVFKSWFVDFEPTRAKMAALDADGSEEDATQAAMTAISGKSTETLATLKTTNAEAYAELHACASLFPSRLVDSELGEIPEGWEVVPFSNMIELIGGGTPKTSVTEYWNGNIPWFSVVDAPNESDVFVIDTEKKVTELGVEKSSTKILPVNTTIISARGTVGRVALVGAPMAMNQSCYGIRGDNLPDYFTYYCVRLAVSELKSRAHGSVFDTITRSTFETLQFLRPKREIATAFDLAIAPLMQAIKQNLKQSQTLTQLCDSLLPKLLSGEISVDAATSQTTEAV
jgi:type I restriction enzyme S subunit